VRERAPKRWPSLEEGLLLVVCAVVAVVRVGGAWGTTPSRIFDSAEYLGGGAPRTKPPLGAWIMSAFPSDAGRSVGFAVAGAVATALLLIAIFSTDSPRGVRWPSIGLIAVWSCSGFGRLWDAVVLPESIGISVGIAAVAAVASGLTRRSPTLLAVAGVLGAAMPAIREPLALPAVAIVALSCWGLVRLLPLRRIGAMLGAGALVGGLGLSLYSISDLGSRRYDVGYVDTTAEGFRTANVIWRRFALVDPAWLAEESISVPDDYERPLVVPTYFEDPANVTSAERGGTSLVARFLVSHPAYALKAPFLDEEGIAFGPSLLDTYDPNHNVSRSFLDGLLEFPGRALGLGLAAITLVLAAWRPWAGPGERVALAGLGGTAMVATMLAWHLDGVEALRHIMPALSVWIAAVPFALASWCESIRPKVKN